MPRTIALIYLVFGALWIFFTDRLLVWMHLRPELILQLQTSKGWLFVVGSALLVYLMLRRYEKRDSAARAALVETQREVQRMNADLEQRVRERTRQLEAANRELESFAYAVSHDLRAPLRSMSGFSQILRESAPAELDEKSRHYLQRIHEASQRMSGLIEDLLGLSRIGRADLNPRPVSLTQVAQDTAAALAEKQPERRVEVVVAPDMTVAADARLLRIAMDNLVGNAFKYTTRASQPRVEVGVQTGESGPVYFVRDNGVGFDMAYAHKLFVPFQRLHPEAEFAGSGIGLVTVQRIIARHGGRIWVEAQPDQGATFYFTLGADEKRAS
jgi:light-regulated signal transduction histidine kinase (bacteriophytochrome)